jgi:hypothetical protein
MKSWKIFVFGIGLIVSILLTSCGGGDSKSQAVEEKVTPPRPLENTLASMNEGGYRVFTDDVIVIRFRSLLEQLSTTYALEPKKGIAESTVVAQKSLRDTYGIKETLLNIMEDMNQVTPTKLNPDYGLYISAYVVLRGKGISRELAIVSIELFLKGAGRY